MDSHTFGGTQTVYSEEELIQVIQRATREKDQALRQQAFAELYTRLDPGVCQTIQYNYRSATPADVQDISQRTWDLVCQKIDDFKITGKPAAHWINKIAWLTTKNYRRKQTKVEQQVLSEPIDEYPFAANTASPEDALIKKERTNIWVSLIKQLSDIQRIVMEGWLAGLSVQEQAEALHTSPSNVYQIRSRTQRQLRQMYARVRSWAGAFWMRASNASIEIAKTYGNAFVAAMANIAAVAVVVIGINSITTSSVPISTPMAAGAATTTILPSGSFSSGVKSIVQQTESDTQASTLPPPRTWVIHSPVIQTLEPTSTKPIEPGKTSTSSLPPSSPKPVAENKPFATTAQPTALPIKVTPTPPAPASSTPQPTRTPTTLAPLPTATDYPSTVVPPYTSTPQPTRTPTNEPHTVEATVLSTCENWKVTGVANPADAVLSYSPAASGLWDDTPSIQVIIQAAWPDSAILDKEVIVHRPEICTHVTPTPTLTPSTEQTTTATPSSTAPASPTPSPTSSASPEPPEQSPTATPSVTSTAPASPTPSPTGTASPEPTSLPGPGPYSCIGPTGPDSIVILFNGEAIRADKSEAKSMTGPFPAEILPGSYRVTLVSYDNHIEHSGGAAQDREQWRLILNDSQGATVATTSAISDLPEDQDWLVESVDENLGLEEEVSTVTAKHDAYPDNNPNSIIPVCAVLDLISTAPDE